MSGSARVSRAEVAGDGSSPLGWHSRGYLPHFDGGAIPQAVTFRLAGSIPATRIEAWIEELARLPSEGAKSKLRARIEWYLDLGRGPTFLRDPRIAGLVQDALLFFDGERYRMHAWVVMPNHVHALFTPLEGFGVPRILQSWKSFSAKQANRVLGRSGRFWQDEYYDRFVRNPQHFTRSVNYIEYNPVQAGLCRRQGEWTFSSARLREAAGGDEGVI